MTNSSGPMGPQPTPAHCIQYMPWNSWSGGHVQHGTHLAPPRLCCMWQPLHNSGAMLCALLWCHARFCDCSRTYCWSDMEPTCWNGKHVQQHVSGVAGVGTARSVWGHLAHPACCLWVNSMIHMQHQGLDDRAPWAASQ